MAYHTIVSHDHIVARAHNHIGTATVVIASAKVVVRIVAHTISVVPTTHRLGVIVGSEVVEHETVGYCRVGTIHIESASTCTVAVCEVVGDDEVFELNAMEHAHTCTTVTVCHIINKVSVSNGESVPLHILIFLVDSRFIATGIFFPIPLVRLIATILIARISIARTIACHMPCRHTHVGLIQYVVALAE